MGRNKSDYPNSYEKNQLTYLDDLEDWKVSGDDVDVRGWKVYTLNGELVGEVKHLIVSPAELRVRYLDVELANEVINAITNVFKGKGSPDTITGRPDSSFISDREDWNVLVPIGLARIDEQKRKVWVSGLSISTYYSLPRHRSGAAISPAYEVAAVGYYDRNYLDRTGNYNRSGYHPDRYREAEFMDAAFYDNEYFYDREGFRN